MLINTKSEKTVLRSATYKQYTVDLERNAVFWAIECHAQSNLATLHEVSI